MCIRDSTDVAAYLWSYCTLETPEEEMECLQTEMRSLHDTNNRILSFARIIKPSNRGKAGYKKIELNYYHHRTWTHLCWSYSAHTGESRYYHDGAVFGTERFNVTKDDIALKSSSEMHDWALILGQEPDKIRGGFAKAQSYLGYISEFNIWNYTLPGKDILDMASCQSQIKGNVVAWKQSELINHNAVVENIRDLSMFCEKRKSLVIFPKKVLLEEAQKTCKIYGGDIVVPKSDQELSLIHI